MSPPESSGGKSTDRAAYSPAEVAARCERHSRGAYSLLHGGNIRAITEVRRIPIPESEVKRMQALAHPYNPKPRTKSEAKYQKTR